MKRVMIELRASAELADAVASGRGVEKLELPGFRPDTEFAPVALPAITRREHSGDARETGAMFDVNMSPGAATWLIRGQMPEDRPMPKLPGNIAGIYADCEVETATICPGGGPLGTDADVERLLGVTRMRRCGMDGAGVLVAIVDTGINLAHLNARGKTPGFDAARSFSSIAGQLPGQAPVGHGTMCAFDVCIAAPRCTLLDIAVLQSLNFGTLLSDIVRAYAGLQGIMAAPRRPGEARSLVVNNSWALFNMASDFPVGDPRNYSDNINHPMNRAVTALEALGADILFAAGNCGADCPDGRCDTTARTIRGANSHPAVLSVAGVDTNRVRVGYSSIGPGRLAFNKPDISGFTHFRGSGVYAADGGTSAACPVVAGVVAALRSIRPFNPADPTSRPAATRALVTSTARDLGVSGYDLAHGFGVVNGGTIARRLCVELKPINICDRFPSLCEPLDHFRFDLCRRYPWLCQNVLPERDFPRPPGPVEFPREIPGRERLLRLMAEVGEDEEQLAEEVVQAYILGMMHAERAPDQPAPAKNHGGGGGCGCKG